MLSRTLEPEVMDSEEEARDYDAMDHSGVNQVFVQDFLAVWDRRSPILDVGTGTSQIPIEFCRVSPVGEVVAIDLAEHMLAQARLNVDKAGFATRIRLEKANARGLSFPSNHFAALISNSIIHHIPEPRESLAEMVRVVAPGGLLFIRDLLRPSDEPTLTTLVKKHAAGANEHQKQMFADSLHAALTLQELRELIAALGFDPGAAIQTTDRHWTWTAHR